MSYSQLALAIAESPTLRLNEAARRLKEAGQPVINLGIGEPKNKTPFNALLSAAARLNSGEVKYTPVDGLPSLKQAIIGYTEENYDRLVAPENIIISQGAKQSLFNLLFALLNPQDEVIVLAPYWVSYPEMIKMVHGVPVIVQPDDGSYQPRLEQIFAAVTASTRAILVNSPNNPSGVVYPADFIGALVEFCERKGIYLICDDIYHKLVFDGCRAVPGYSLTRHDIESSHVLVLNGVSKLYGMTGFRIGWTVAPRSLVAVMANVQGQISSCTSVVLQAAAEGALRGLQSVTESLRLTIENNRNVVMEQFKAFAGVRVPNPRGAFYCLPDFRAYQGDSGCLAQFLLERALVVTVPGKEFGAEGHLRLSFAGSAKDLIEGLARIRWALDPTAPNDVYIGDKHLIRDWL